MANGDAIPQSASDPTSAGPGPFANFPSVAQINQLTQAPAPTQPPPTINIDQNADPATRIRQATVQGGVPVFAPDGTAGYVHRSYADQFLNDNPDYKRGVFMTAPDGIPGRVPIDQAADFQNHGYQAGLPVPKDISQVTDPKDPRYGSDEWYASKMPQPVMDGLNWLNEHFFKPKAEIVGRIQGIAGDVAERTAATALTDPFGSAPLTMQQLEAARQQYPRSLGIARGVGTFAGGFSDPTMWPLLFAGGALPAVQKLAGLGFSGQMLYGAYHSYPEFKAALDSGNTERAYELLTDMGLSTALGLKGLHGEISPAAKEITTRVATRAAQTMGFGYTPSELLIKAGGPSVQGQEGATLPQAIETAAPRLVEQNKIRKIQTVGDVADGAYMASRRVWEDGYQPQIDRHPDETFDATPIGDSVRSGVDEGMRDLFPEQAKKADSFADKFQGDLTLDKASSYLRALNAQLKSYYKMGPEGKSAAGVTDGLISAYESAAEGLRDHIDTTLESLGEQDPRGLRQEYGALKQIQRVFEKRAVVTGRHKLLDWGQVLGAGAGAGEAAGAILTGHPLGALAGVLPYAATTAAKYYNSPDVMVRRAIAGFGREAGPARPLGAAGSFAGVPRAAAAGAGAGAASAVMPSVSGGAPAAPPALGAGQYAMPPSSTQRPPGAQPALPPAQGVQAPASSLAPQGQLPAAPARPQLTGEVEAPPLQPQLGTGPRETPRGLLGPARLPASISGERAAAEAAAARGTNVPAWTNLGQEEPLFAGKQTSIAQAHRKAISNMLLGAEAPPESMDWDVVRPGRGLPNAIRLNDTARTMIGASMGTGFGGASVSPATLDSEVLPRLEMTAQAIDNTRAQRPDYFSPDASAKVRDLIQTIQQNRGPEGISFARSEGTPEQQRYTTHEELFHTAVQRRPAAQPGGLHVPDMADDPGFDSMRQRIYNETGRLTSLVQNAEGMADIMQGRAPELTPEQAGSSAETYWTRLASSGKQGLQALVDAFKLENFMDDHEQQNGYTVDDATNAIRTAGRNALARVLSREYGTDLRGLARAVQGEAGPANVGGPERGAIPAGPIPPSGGEANLGSPAETAAGAGGSPTPEVAPSEQALFSREAPGDEHIVSTRNPTGDAEDNAFDPHTDRSQTIGMKQILDAGIQDKVMKAIQEYPGMKGLLKGVTDPKEAMRKFVNFTADNLVAMHKLIPENIRNLSKLWYSSANNLANELADTHAEHGMTPQQAAGVIAVNSPQTDWNMNVSRARRIMDIWLNHQDTPYTEEMAKKAPDIKTASLQDTLNAIKGKGLGELTDPYEQAMWIRLYDEAHNPTSYEIWRPDGTVLDVARKQPTNAQQKAGQPGDPAKMAWANLDHIAKSIEIMKDESIENISDNLGDKHKVRNFYNNIINPDGLHGHVTVDTHAVAAGLWRPVAGDDIEPSHNFGSGKRAVKDKQGNIIEPPIPSAGSNINEGVHGTYGLYADAYRLAAQKLGVLPRELQSMTWEGIRSLFPDTFKTVQANKDIIDGIWKQVDRGALTAKQARSKVIDAVAQIKGTDRAGIFTKPDWLSDSGLHEAEGPAAEPQDVSGAGIYGGRTQSSGSRTGSGNPRGSPRQRIAPSPVPAIFKRVSRSR